MMFDALTLNTHCSLTHSLGSADDEAAAELEGALLVVDERAEGEGEGQREQLLLHD